MGPVMREVAGSMKREKHIRGKTPSDRVGKAYPNVRKGMDYMLK